MIVWQVHYNLILINFYKQTLMNGTIQPLTALCNKVLWKRSDYKYNRQLGNNLVENVKETEILL